MQLISFKVFHKGLWLYPAGMCNDIAKDPLYMMRDKIFNRRYDSHQDMIFYFKCMKNFILAESGLEYSVNKYIHSINNLINILEYQYKSYIAPRYNTICNVPSKPARIARGSSFSYHYFYGV